MRARVTVGLLALAVGVGSIGAPAVAQVATASLAGTVTSSGGEPLEGVCVEAFAGGYAVTETGSDGSFTLPDLQAGDYTVGFNSCGERLPGFAPQFFDGARTVDDADTVSLAEGEARTGVNAALEATGSLSGTVTDDDSGEPIEGICVAAINGQTGAFGQGRSDEGGDFVVADVPAGDYTVAFGDCVEPFFYVPELFDDVQVDGQQPSAEPADVVVASGEDTGGIDAGLTLGGSVQGTVTALHTGRQQPLVCVGLFETDAQAGDRPAALALTGLSPTPETLETSPGAFTLPGVMPGEYVLAFNPGVCEDDGYLTSWYDGQPTRDDATVVTVTAGEAGTDLDTVLTPLPSISFACPFELGAAESTFSDVPEGNVHRQAIECLSLFGVVAGRGDGSYGPTLPVTRAQLASFVARTLEAAALILPADPADAFDDDNGDVHERAINQLAELGVVRGRGERRYAPADNVNRAQMATFLVNAYEQATGVELQASEDRFADDERNVHEAAINKVATAGITAGTGSGYAPNVVVRRDQMASFLARLLDRVQRDGAFEAIEEDLPPAEEGQRSSFAVRAAPAAPPAAAREAAVGSLRRLVENAARR